MFYYMWFFRRKKQGKEYENHIRCPSCHSINTGAVLYHGTDRPVYVKVWRGVRSFTYRCFDCGHDFYSDIPPEKAGSPLSKDSLIDDEEALHKAEEELYREMDEDNDRMCR